MWKQFMSYLYKSNYKWNLPEQSFTYKQNGYLSDDLPVVDILHCISLRHLSINPANRQMVEKIKWLHQTCSRNGWLSYKLIISL